MRRLLTTGGAGFIGGNFVHRRLREHAQDRVVVLDALPYAGNLATQRDVSDRGERTTFVHGDICDAELVERLFAEHAIETVVRGTPTDMAGGHPPPPCLHG